MYAGEDIVIEKEVISSVSKLLTKVYGLDPAILACYDALGGADDSLGFTHRLCFGVWSFSCWIWSAG